MAIFPRKLERRERRWESWERRRVPRRWESEGRKMERRASMKNEESWAKCEAREGSRSGGEGCARGRRCYSPSSPSSEAIWTSTLCLASDGDASRGPAFLVPFFRPSILHCLLDVLRANLLHLFPPPSTSLHPPSIHEPSVTGFRRFGRPSAALVRRSSGAGLHAPPAPDSPVLSW